VLGLPGLLVALLLRFTVEEPPRGISERRTHGMETSTFPETLRFLMQSRSWVLLVVGCSFLSIPGYGVLMWGYEFFGRVHGLSPVETGQWMALMVGGGGCLGTILGGPITDRLGTRKPSRRISVPALLTMAGVPFGLVFLLADSVALSLACFFPYSLLLNVYIPAMYSVNQSLARLHMRATASAILLFTINIVGAGAGPFIVGALSDMYSQQQGAESLRYALATVAVLTAVGSGILVLCGRTLQEDCRRVSGQSDAGK